MNSELSRKIVVASGLAVVVGIIAVTFAVRSKHPIPVAQISSPPPAAVQTPDAPTPVAPTADAPAAVVPTADVPAEVPATDKIGAKIGDASSSTAVEPKAAANRHQAKARTDVDTADRTAAADSLANKTENVKKVDELPMPATVSRTVPDAQDGTASNEPASSDNLITTEVKSQFAADSVSKDVDIGVTTTQGVVVLSGTLVTQDAIDHIRNVAEKVKDVKSVDISAMKITST